MANLALRLLQMTFFNVQTAQGDTEKRDVFRDATWLLSVERNLDFHVNIVPLTLNRHVLMRHVH